MTLLPNISQKVRMPRSPVGTAIVRFAGRGHGKTPGGRALQMEARLRGFEPPTHGLEVRCSIQLSYRRMFLAIVVARRPLEERATGFEPATTSLEGWSSTN
jgi:hypothetical protein